jgi:excinuclease ABC subunit A
VLANVTGVSGSGKSTLVSQFLVEAMAERLGHALPVAEGADYPVGDKLQEAPVATMAERSSTSPGAA